MTSPITGTLVVGFVWFFSGFIASCLLRGLLREVFKKTGERYSFQHERRCNYFFWFGPMSLFFIVPPIYKAFGVRRPYFCVRMPKDLCEKDRP